VSRKRAPIETYGLDPDSEWYTVEMAAAMTQRNPVLIHRWVAEGRINPEHVTRGTKWPYPTLLSPEALLTIVKIPRRKRQISPAALSKANG
jgi:hypothetical protein